MDHEPGWNPFMEYNGIEIITEGAEQSVLKAAIGSNSLNPYGMIHGGLIYTMIDCAAGITARADGNAYVTQNSYVNYLGNVKDANEIYAETNVVRRGRSIVVVHVIVQTPDKKILADAVVDMYRVVSTRSNKATLVSG